MAPTPFSSWPEELIAHIFLLLGDRDSLALRATCRDMERKTFHDFKQRFFRSRSVRFTRKSLRNLVQIAIHEMFNRSVETLTVSLQRWDYLGLHAKLWLSRERPSKRHPECLEHRGPGHKAPSLYDRIERNFEHREAGALYDGSPAGAKRERSASQERPRSLEELASSFDADVRERLQLLEAGPNNALALLRVALARLPNLRAIALADHSTRDQTMAFALGRKMGYPVYGCSCVEMILDSSSEFADEFGGLQRLRKIEWHSLITDLMRSFPAARPLEHLTTLDICLVAQDLEQAPVLPPSYVASQLESLTLEFTESGQEIPWDHPYDASFPNSPRSMDGEADRASWLLNWVNSCHRLKNLTLLVGVPLTAVRIANFASIVRFPALERLHIAGCIDIASLLYYCRFLTFLRIHRPTLRSLSLSNAMFARGDTDHGIGPFLRFLSTFPCLTSVTFTMWREDDLFVGEEPCRVLISEDKDREQVFAEAESIIDEPWRYEGSPSEVSAKLLSIRDHIWLIPPGASPVLSAGGDFWPRFVSDTFRR